MIEKNKKNIEIIVVIPVYNEGKSIYDLLCNINKVGVRNLALIIINDKSTDDSLDWINKFKNDNKGICLQVISHEDNLGLGGALNTGLTYCLKNYNFNILFTMDGDNTHDPSLIPNMINEINSGKDIVIASRYRPGAKVSGIPRHRIFLSYCARICYSIFWNLKGVRDYTCLFRAHTKSILDMAFPNKDEVILKEKQGLSIKT